MSLRRLGGAAIAAAGAFALLTTTAFAHPLGNFSVNRYSRVEIGPERTTLRYVLDLAEIPTLQELQAAGLGAETPEDDVKGAILASRVARIADAAQLTLDGRRVAWDVRDAALALPPGQAGLRTLRISLTLEASAPARSGDAIAYRDANEPGRSGWHEIVLRGVDGIALAGSSVPSRDASDELRRYPADPLVAPPDADRATAVVGTVAIASIAPVAPGSTTARLGVDAGVEGITAYLRRGVAGDPFALALAFAVAALLGAAHALTPGHGKTIMAAFLVGTRGDRSRALVLGLAVAASHTLGVTLLAALVLGASSAVAPERLYPVLSALSAATVVAIGAWLIGVSMRERAHAREHAHGHEHHHDHADGHGRAGWRALIALGVSGGLVPSASALIVLLAAVAVRRPDLGLLLVAAFGAGMATVLVGLGLALVGVRDVASRRPALAPLAQRVRAYVPLVTAIVVMASGLMLSAQAVAQLVPL